METPLWGPLHTLLGGLCILITSPVPAARFSGYAMRALYQVCRCLLWEADLRLWPSWQMSTVQDPRKTWLASLEPAHRLVEDAGLWGRDCPLPSSSGCCTTTFVSVSGGGACMQLALLWCSLNPLFCEQARLCVSLESFMRKFSLSFPFIFSLSGYPTV